MYETDSYANKNPSWHEEDAPWKAGHIERMLRRNRAACETICEVGCGTGDVLLQLEAAFPESRLVGYEIAPAAYERAKKKETDRTRFFLDDPIAHPPENFDLLLAIDVIEHVEDYLSFLKGLRPLARVKVFHIPLDLSVQSVFRSRGIIALREGVGHIHYFYKETALAALRDCGYHIVDHVYTASRLELPNQQWPSQMMALPRRLAYALGADLAVRVLGGYSLLVLAE